MGIAGELKKWAGAAAVALLLVAGCGAAQEPERPLPEVAKEKTGKTAARVFTNEDLEPGREQASPPTPAMDARPAAAEEDGPKARITVPGLLEGGSPEEARKILQSLKNDEQVLLRRYAQIQDRLATENDPHLRQLYSASLSRREETLARKRKQIQEVEKAIKLSERDRSSEARRPNGPGTGVAK